MSGRWFRFYADAIRNPKVARLSDKDFRYWVELLAVAAEHDGLIPCLDDLKHMLKVRLDHLSTVVDRLISIGLIDRLGHGYEPHNWSKFQYKSDTSTKRVTRHREKRNVSETPPEAETEAEIPSPNGEGHSPDSDKRFWTEAKAYLGKPALIGRWCRDFGKPQTARAITAAQIERAVDPVSFIEAALRRGSQRQSELLGPC